MCLLKITSQYHREKNSDNEMHSKCVVVDSNVYVLPSAMRDLSSAPQTENGMGSSSGTEESK